MSDVPSIHPALEFREFYNGHSSGQGCLGSSKTCVTGFLGSRNGMLRG